MGLKTLTITLVLGAGLIFSVFQFGISRMENLLPEVPTTVLKPRAAAPAGADKKQNAASAAEIASTAKTAAVLPLPEDGEIKKMAAATTTAVLPPVSEAPKVVKSPPPDAALTRQGVIEQTNIRRRTSLGAGYDLAENNLLDIAAQNKVNDMFSGQYFEHTSASGISAGGLVAAAGYEYIAVGENLAMGDFDSDADLVDSWMNSPGHRANILKAGYKEIGVAAGYGMFNGRMTWLAVQEFGTPKNACPAVDENLSAAVDSAKSALESFTQTQGDLSLKIDREKITLNTLKNDLENLIGAGGSAVVINQKQEEYNAAVSKSNRDIDSYNANIKQAQSLYNNYKTQASIYNSQVSAFNSCASAIK